MLAELQSHDRCGWKSPVATAIRIADQMAVSVRSEPLEFGSLGSVGQLLAVGEIHQLQPVRDNPAVAPQRQRVELHLEQRPRLAGFARCAPVL